MIASLTGTDRTEQIPGRGGGNDLVKGRRGPEEIGDGLERDQVYGGGGAHKLIGQGYDISNDRFFGGGNDTVQSRDVSAPKDTVSRGTSTGTVSADKDDVVADACERVRTW